MQRALSTAASGMQAQQTRLDVTSHNIANVSTPGFKKGRAEFSDLLYARMELAGAPTSDETVHPTGTQVGLGVKLSGTHRMHSQGSLQVTSNPLDLAIEGDGFFQVVMPDGSMAYTRAGNLKLDPEGRIVTAQGFPLAGDMDVPPDAQSITVAGDGAVTVMVPTQVEALEVGRIELAIFANPAGLSSEGHNHYRPTASSGLPITGAPGENGSGTLSQGTLETSNVKIVEEMIDLISGQRAYEVNARVVQAADEMLQQASNLR